MRRLPARRRIRLSRRGIDQPARRPARPLALKPQPSGHPIAFRGSEAGVPCTAPEFEQTYIFGRGRTDLGGLGWRRSDGWPDPGRPGMRSLLT